MLDALIAGAGPAGAATALLLARARKSVCIYERSIFPRTKACGEYLSAGAVGLLYALGVGETLAAQARPVRGVRLHGHGVQVRIDFPQPGWSLPRCVLDEALLNAALRAGAQMIRARLEECRDGREHAEAAGVHLPDGERFEMRAGVVVGADGMHSLIARKCALASPPAGGGRFAVGGHYTGFHNLDTYIDMIVDGTTYVAINPLTDTSANVMVVSDRPDDAEEIAQHLAGDLLAGTMLEGKRIAIGPLAHRARRLAGSRVLLAGDSARFIDPFTGQGVYLALKCAHLAAQSIITGDLRAYERCAAREIDRRERAARRIGRIIGSRSISRVAAAMMQRHARLFAPLVSRVTGAA